MHSTTIQLDQTSGTLRFPISFSHVFTIVGTAGGGGDMFTVSGWTVAELTFIIYDRSASGYASHTYTWFAIGC